MRLVRMLSAAAALVTGLAAADLVCESNNSISATYNWDSPAAWNCYSQSRAAVANEYPGKNYPANNYVAIIGAATGAKPEIAMNVNAPLGVLGKNYRTFSITGTADDGSGAIRATCSGCASTSGTFDNTKVQANDKVYCYGWSGTGTQQNAGYGIWTVTVGDANTFTLTGSSFAAQGASRTGTCEFPAALKRQGAYGSTATVGNWKINAGVTATFRGDVVDTWQNAGKQSDQSYWMVRCGDPANGGCTWIWDGSGPTAYVTASAGIAQNLAYYIHGTPWQRATVTCLNGGSACATNRKGAFSANPGFGISGVDIDYADFSNLGGSASWLCVYASSTAPATYFTMQHFTVANSSYVNFAAGTGPLGGFALAYGTFAADSCQSSGLRCLYRVGAPSGGSLTIGPAVAFLPVASGFVPVESTTTPGQVIFDKCYFAQGMAYPAITSVAAAQDSTIRNSLFAKTVDGLGSLGSEMFQNNYFWQGSYASGNNHGWSLPSMTNPGSKALYATKLIFEGNVLQFEEGFSDGLGNIMDEIAGLGNGVTPAIDLHWRNNVYLPNTDYDGGTGDWTSINSMALVEPIPGLRWHVYNNTHFTQHDSASAILLGHSGAQPQAGKLAEYRCNAVVSPPGNSIVAPNNYPNTLVSVENFTSLPLDAADPTGLHHNAAFGYLDRRATAAPLAANPAFGSMYQMYLSQTPAGVANGTDQNYDHRMPQVVDRTRRLRGWVNQKYGQSFTDDRSALAYLRADVDGAGPTRLLDIPDLVTWVKAGWTLNEPALYKACGDGTHIGAAVAAPSVNPAVSGVIVARGKATAAPAASALD